MTRTPIAPVIPRRRPATASSPSPRRTGPRTHRPLPLAVLASRPNPAAVYGTTTVDRVGRLADRAVMRALGWAPGMSVDITEAGGVLVVRAAPAGGFRTSGDGFLALPARVRRWCGLRPGDRVLLAADPPSQELLVVPPAVLDAMVETRRTRASEQSPSAGHDRPEGGELS